MEPIKATVQFERVGLDILGPFLPSNKEDCHIVAVEFFYEMDRNKGNSRILCRTNGSETQSTTGNQGKCFKNAVFAAGTRLQETKHRTTPYHPLGQGKTLEVQYQH